MNIVAYRFPEYHRINQSFSFRHIEEPEAVNLKIAKNEYSKDCHFPFSLEVIYTGKEQGRAYWDIAINDKFTIEQSSLLVDCKKISVTALNENIYRIKIISNLSVKVLFASTFTSRMRFNSVKAELLDNNKIKEALVQEAKEGLQKDTKTLFVFTSASAVFAFLATQELLVATTVSGTFNKAIISQPLEIFPGCFRVMIGLENDSNLHSVFFQKEHCRGSVIPKNVIWDAEQLTRV